MEPNKTSWKRYTEKHHLDYKYGSDVSRKSKGGMKFINDLLGLRLMRVMSPTGIVLKNYMLNRL